jgi:hypothetical protein
VVEVVGFAITIATRFGDFWSVTFGSRRLMALAPQGGGVVDRGPRWRRCEMQAMQWKASVDCTACKGGRGRRRAFLAAASAVVRCGSRRFSKTALPR